MTSVARLSAHPTPAQVVAPTPAQLQALNEVRDVARAVPFYEAVQHQLQHLHG